VHFRHNFQNGLVQKKNCSTIELKEIILSIYNGEKAVMTSHLKAS